MLLTGTVRICGAWEGKTADPHRGVSRPFNKWCPWHYREIAMPKHRITVYLLRPKGRPFQLQWVDPDTGQRRTCSAETTVVKDAERLRSDKEYELNHGKRHDGSRMSWERFRQMFEAEYLAGLRGRTSEKYGTVFDVFEQIINPQSLAKVTERTLSLFVCGMRERPRKQGKIGLAPQTMRNYLIALKTAFAWAVDQKLIAEMPAFPTVKVPKKKPQPIPTESFERLLAKAPDDTWKAFLLCGWWAGLRLSEAWQLRWDASDEWPWIDWEGNRIVLPSVFVKAGEDQWVPLHPTLRQTLAALPRTSDRVFLLRGRGGRVLNRNNITQRVLLMAKAAGVKLSMHKLRKGFGCRVAKQLGKGNAPVLHELMRHSSMQVSMSYYANVGDVLHEAMEELK